MIDWVGFAVNALWVLGLAVCLAALSMAHHQARAETDRLWRVLRRPGFQLALASGTSLFCIGVLLASSPWWEKGFWGLGAILSVVWLTRLSRGRRAALERRT